MNFKIALLLNCVPGILGDLLVLLVVVFGKKFCHQFVLADLVLLELKGPSKSVELGLCFHAVGRHRLFPSTVASCLHRADPMYGCAGPSVATEF